MAEETNTELPDECWDMIFKHLNHESDQDSVSLVCKRFLSITNFIKVSIKVTPSIQVLSSLLQRFTNLKKIQLRSFQGDLNKAVCAVAQSGLDLEELDLSYNGSLQTVCFDELGLKMRNLKVLDCSGCLGDADLVKIANSLTQLEELQIGQHSYKYRIVVTDEGIDYLSSKLKRLRKIDLVHNLYISDKSLVSLSSNCVFLEHITVSYCRNVTINGISFLINNSCHLKFLRLCEHCKIESFRFTTFLPKLQILRFVNLSISDEFLYSIASARIPLTEFSLSSCESYTFTGISRLLHSCHQSLKSLVLRVAKFLTDEHIQYLSSFLYNLTSIKLFYCRQLSDSAFVTLTQSCPLLRHLEMRETSLGKTKYNNDGMIKKNFAIKYLDLSSNSCLSTSCLKKLINICPKVEKIKLSCCFQLNEQLEVADILECNNGVVKYLLLRGCLHLVVSLKDQKFSNLEMLVAKASGMNGAMLAMIGRICPALVHLDLEGCDKMTDEGIKEVVRLCKRLRYLSLSACTYLDISIVAWIVSNSQSLRTLVSPSHTYPDEEEQKQFLQQGCLVSKGVHYAPDE